MSKRGRKPKWEVAYHFGLDRNVSISEVLKMRRGNDPRAGDLWCHKACYPNTGDRISSRDCSNSNRSSHFAKWKGEDKFKSDCSYFSFSRSRRESISYAQYYHDMKIYFSELDKNQPPFMIGEIELPNNVSEPDLTISHSSNSNLGWSKTHIVIVDSNTKRAKKFRRNGHFRINQEYYLVIVISELTPEQLADFQRSGIDRIMLSWLKLLEEIEQYNSPFAQAQRLIEQNANHRRRSRMEEKRKSKEQKRKEAKERQLKRERKQDKVLQHPNAQIYVKIVHDKIKELEQKISPLISNVEDLRNCEFYKNGKLCRHIKDVPFSVRRITDYRKLHNDELTKSEEILTKSNASIEIASIKNSMYSAVKNAAHDIGFDLDSLMEDED